MFYSKDVSNELVKEKGYTMIEDAGRGYRRVVPSPRPIDIIEKNLIKKLVDEGNIVIAVGGGGITVVKEGNTLKGVEAVIDKDRSEALLGKLIDSDKLLILTSIDKVYLNYNTSNQIALDTLTIE